MEQYEKAPEEVVILVHGTFASDPADEGERWWQKGSFFYEELSKRLPTNIRLVEPGEMFRWGGENSQTYRFAAAVKLLKVIENFEARKIPYHIVAHSHGGSVAWAMLFLKQTRYINTLARKKSGTTENASDILGLPYLRSLVTVGTPFIRLRPPSFFDERSWPSFLFFGLLFLFAIASRFELLSYSVQIFIAICMCAVFGVGIVLNAGAWVERNLLKRQSEFETVPLSVISPYATRWLGLWADEDEAIALLQAAHELSHSPQSLHAPEPSLPYEIFPKFLPIVLWPAYKTRKYVQRKTLPIIDRLLKIRLASIVLGVDDVRGVQCVTPWPHEDLQRENALPKDVQIELRDACDRALSTSALGARPALRYLSEGEVEDAFRAFGDTNNALIHNSYFNNSAIIDIIAAKIKGMNP